MPNQTPATPNKADDMPVPARQTQATSPTVLAEASLSAAPLVPPASSPSSLSDLTQPRLLDTPNPAREEAAQQSAEAQSQLQTHDISQGSNAAAHVPFPVEYSPPFFNPRATRSQKVPYHLILPETEWEALDISKAKGAAVPKPKPKVETKPKSQPKPVLESSPKSEGTMSRNRARGPPGRDNGATNEEVDLWNRICHDVHKAREKYEKQTALAQQIMPVLDNIKKGGNNATLAQLDELEPLYRQTSRACEDEVSTLAEMLGDRTSGVQGNLEVLMALRTHTETKQRKRKGDTDNSATDSPAPSVPPVSDKLSRVKSSAQRSTSVSSSQTREAREALSAKGEAGAEGMKSTTGDKTDRLFVGAEVVFKHNKKQQGVEGEGIQCIIQSISGEGAKKRYDVQDPVPENADQGAVYKTTAASLIPIPQVGAALPHFVPGKQVLARYPETTTFYRAEVMAAKKDVYRLRFEGEEENDKETEVDRRFVLDIPGR
ncbi:SAGA HAT/Core module component [Onygenales sp. PD_40]|nr:SAGA HAT/Core module component [Onygenales sp. PD_40]KAK2795697.1 SAGA HAT/Core module component [Onygenales sp. PD_12]KAK2801407.1 SAGA HAT/Core module component [Onygenales sp. PD_10]